jgi:hypothetical protein
VTTEREITVLTDAALVTCIVQKGLADKIVAAAREAAECVSGSGS